MATISQLLGMEDEVRDTIHAEGCDRKGCACPTKVYKLSPFTLEIQALWTQYLKNRAWAELQAMKGLMTPEEYRDARADLINQFATDQYGLMSANSIRAATQAFGEGLRHLMFLRMKPNHPEVDEKTIWDVIERQAEEIKFLMDSQDAVPNSTPPQTAGEKAGVLQASSQR